MVLETPIQARLTEIAEDTRSVLLPSYIGNCYNGIFWLFARRVFVLIKNVFVVLQSFPYIKRISLRGDFLVLFVNIASNNGNISALLPYAIFSVTNQNILVES